VAQKNLIEFLSHPVVHVKPSIVQGGANISSNCFDVVDSFPGHHFGHFWAR
jgi:hypothetical protein